MKKLATTLTLLTVALLGTGCGSDDGQGTIVVTAYGESYIEDGIPSSVIDDGWSVDFDHFKVTIDDVNVGGNELRDLKAIDLTESSSGDGQELGAVLVSAGDHTDSSFAIKKVEVEGEATKKDVTKTFHWIFEQTTAYTECEATTKVKAAGSATFQVTVHADHLLFDSIVASDPAVLFGPLAAADRDDDGEITQQELEQTDVGDYDPGSEGGIEDLWAYLMALSRTVGHVNGEGHCEAHRDD